MEGLEDDFVIPNQDQNQQNIADFESAPNSLHKYCLLCKYGSCADQETDGNVNRKIKTLEKIIASLRGQVCRTKVRRVVSTYYYCLLPNTYLTIITVTVSTGCENAVRELY